MTRRGDPRKPTEFQLQAAVMDYIRLNKAPDLVVMHVPNQQASGPRRGAYLKRMGVFPGASDLLLIKRRPRTGPTMYEAMPQVLWLELKAPGKKPTHTQKLFEMAVLHVGCEYRWADNFDETIALLKRGGWTR